MQLTSSAFADGETIPRQYGQAFGNYNPPLSLHDLPTNTVSLVLTMDDPDVPPAAGVPVWDHWVVFNIPPTITDIPKQWTPAGTCGSGTRGFLAYSGPKPPDKEHRYFFHLYALDSLLPLEAGATKQQVYEAMDGHVIEEAQLMGRFAPT